MDFIVWLPKYNGYDVILGGGRQT